jgi:hypothetical protein
MLNANIKISDGITPVLKGMKKELRRYPQEAEAKFKSLTPIDKGNARRRTRLKNKNEIEANYPYAQRLDEGWSKQAPQGMTKPFEAWVRQKVKQIFGK